LAYITHHWSRYAQPINVTLESVNLNSEDHAILYGFLASLSRIFALKEQHLSEVEKGLEAGKKLPRRYYGWQKVFSN
jgi:hypothetical protein